MMIGMFLSRCPIKKLALLTVPAMAMALLSAAPAHAATYKLTLSASGLDEPVYMANPPGENKRYFIVEKGGKILVLKNGTVLSTPYLDISSKVSTAGEGGLLGLAFDPSYSSNRRIYL